MLPLHRRHQQLLQEAYARDSSSSMEAGGGMMDKDFNSELNATAANLENMSMSDKIPPSLRILRWEKL